MNYKNQTWYQIPEWASEEEQFALDFLKFFILT